MATHKVIKVRIRRGGIGEDLLKYPGRYDAHEVDRKGIGPTNVMGISAYSGHIGMGGEEEWCIIILPNSLAEEYAKDPDMHIISREQAEREMQAWRGIKTQAKFGAQALVAEEDKPGPVVMSLADKFPQINIE